MTRPLGLLVMGQSNAANSGDRPIPPPEGVICFAWPVERLVPARGWLWGANGKNSNVWAQVGGRLVQDGVATVVTLAAMVAGGRRVREWVPGGRLSRQLDERLKILVRHRIKIDFITWMQGESDFTTPATEYTADLLRVYDMIRQHGIHAPMIVAIESRFHSEHPHIREAQLQAIAQNNSLMQGPYLDDLDGPKMRYQGDHFTTDGQDIVAQRWVQTIREAMQSQGSSDVSRDTSLMQFPQGNEPP